jgi:hypothetical protein
MTARLRTNEDKLFDVSIYQHFEVLAENDVIAKNYIEEAIRKGEIKLNTEVREMKETMTR